MDEDTELKPEKILKNLKFLTNDQIKNLVPFLNDRYFLYEMINLLQKKGYEFTYNFLQTKKSEESSDRKILFENPLIQSAKDKFYLDMEIYRTKPEVSAGERCLKCGSEETIAIEKQMRSGDEAVSIAIQCLQCKFKWRSQ